MYLAQVVEIENANGTMPSVTLARQPHGAMAGPCGVKRSNYPTRRGDTAI